MMNRRAFTLLELMLTISLVGFVLVSSRLLLSQVVDTKALIVRDAAQSDSLANGRWMLRSLVRNAEATPDSTELFLGDARSAQFTSWCRAASGWPERCRVTVTLDQHTDTTFVIAAFGNNSGLALFHLPGAAMLKYVDRSIDAAWSDAWGPSLTVPNAVAILTATDTTMLNTGAPHG